MRQRSVMQKSRFLGLVGGAALLAGMTMAAGAGAQPTPFGIEFVVNSHTPGNQANPAACAGADGSVVIVWNSDNQLGASGRDVFGQRYTGTGATAGAEFRVNTYTTGNQDDPKVACSSDGSFVVVWESDGQDGDRKGVFARSFSSAAEPEADEFRVNEYTTLNQRHPAIAYAESGDVVIVWESEGQDGNGVGVYGMHLSSPTASTGAEFQINNVTLADQENPSVAAGAGGNFFVVWQDDYVEPDDPPLVATDIFGMSLSRSGVPNSTVARINTIRHAPQQNPDIAAMPNGRFVVVWQSTLGDGNSEGIAAQQIAPGGGAVGPEFQVNTFTADSQDNPSVTVSPGGLFLVAWESRGQDGSGNGVFGQLFAGDATRLGPEFIANTATTDSQNQVAVAASEGLATIIWRGAAGLDGSGDGVFARRYDLSGVGVPTTTVVIGTTTTMTTTTVSITTTTLPTTTTTLPVTTTIGPTTTLPLTTTTVSPTTTTSTTLPTGDECADANASGGITSGDALFVLRAAVGLLNCEACRCDTSGDGVITAADALITLRAAVGIPVPLLCPACS